MHIVLASIEKVVPTLEDAAVLLRVLARSATGQESSAYTTLITGPQRPGDLDGPEHYHVVILDNGRSVGAGHRDAGHAALHPLRRLHEPLPGLWRDRRPCLWLGLSRPDRRGADAAAARASRKPANLPNASTFCGRCESVCPVRIPLPKLMRHWREREFERHLTPRAVRQGLALWSFVARRPRLYKSLTGLANRMLALFGRADGRYGNLPLAGGWTRFRDFPAPQPGGTFHAQWKRRKP